MLHIWNNWYVTFPLILLDIVYLQLISVNISFTEHIQMASTNPKSAALEKLICPEFLKMLFSLADAAFLHRHFTGWWTARGSCGMCQREQEDWVCICKLSARDGWPPPFSHHPKPVCWFFFWSKKPREDHSLASRAKRKPSQTLPGQ